MKLSTIIRAALASIVDVHTFGDRISIWTNRATGPGLSVSAGYSGNGYPPRAKHLRIGDLHVHYWGRDTMVHPAPEAS